MPVFFPGVAQSAVTGDASSGWKTCGGLEESSSTTAIGDWDGSAALWRGLSQTKEEIAETFLLKATIQDARLEQMLPRST
jgi:hypothetical protein